MFKILFFICELIFYAQYIVIGILLKFILFKTKVYYEDDNKQNKQLNEGVLIISNHRSFLDGLVITLKYFFKRWHFISENFFKTRLKAINFIVRVAGGVFIDTKISDFDFIEDCKKLFSRGRPVIIFPEGDFKHTYEPQKFYTGYVLLAVKTGVKIVPVANDFNYSLFKRVHIMIGNTIDLSEYTNAELTREKRKEINEIVRNKFLLLFYALKRKKAEKFSFIYKAITPNPGDVVRINTGSGYHYGIYLNDNEVIQSENTVNSVSLKEFCGNQPPEVRIIKKRHTRKLKDIEKYAKSCLGQGLYNMETNNCLDFVNRVTLNI